VKTVTRLRSAGRETIAVELAGRPWRTVPTEAAVRAGLASGIELDRGRARKLARELRRLRALRAAGAALTRRDRSVQELRARLDARGIQPREREETLATLASAGLVDDARFALGRAQALAGRGAGDALIRADLEARGVASEHVAAALEALEPEIDRAATIVARRGPGPKAARYLAARGFGEDAVAAAVAAEDTEPVD
jgi:SOS response regulatory protein OraA/RecX